MPFDKQTWAEANREKARLHSARYRLRKKGMDLPPETLAEIEAQREAKRLAGIERRKELNRRWNREHKEQRASRTKERYNNDPEFRAHKLALAKASRERRKTERTDEEKAESLRRRREAAAKACRAASAKAALSRKAQAPKPAPKPNVLTEAQKAAPRWKLKKPGRLMALCGWNGC